MIAFLFIFGTYDLMNTVYTGSIASDLVRPCPCSRSGWRETWARAGQPGHPRHPALLAFCAVLPGHLPARLLDWLMTVLCPAPGLAGLLCLALPGQPGRLLDPDARGIGRVAFTFSQLAVRLPPSAAPLPGLVRAPVPPNPVPCFVQHQRRDLPGACSAGKDLARPAQPGSLVRRPSACLQSGPARRCAPTGDPGRLTCADSLNVLAFALDPAALADAVSLLLLDGTGHHWPVELFLFLLHLAGDGALWQHRGWTTGRGGFPVRNDRDLIRHDGHDFQRFRPGCFLAYMRGGARPADAAPGWIWPGQVLARAFCCAAWDVSWKGWWC